MTSSRAGGGPRRHFAGASLFALMLSLAGAPSCEPIEARPLNRAPMNMCPCEKFERGASTAARCSERDRCEIFTAGGRPEFPFWIVVHVPDDSIFAPGLTYVLYSNEVGEPAFKGTVTPGVTTRCTPPLCLQLGGVGAASGAYKVTSEASAAVGYPLAEGTSIPVRVVYEQTGNEQQESFPPLPLDLLFGSSRVGKDQIEFVRPVPFGNYRRVFYPQPPFDAFFPPTIDSQTIGSENFVDFFFLGADKPLDDVTGDSRIANIRRADGLEGWRVWLVDRPSQRRISVLRTLSGTEATNVRLDTTGEQRTPGGGLGDDVEAVVAPPESWTAVPRLVTRLFSGAGLKNLIYPATPPPVTVTGVVAEPSDGGTLLGYAARVSFASEGLATLGEPTTLLRYTATVNTDDRGRFATVLPLGTYAATVEPAEGTGFAKTRQLVVVDSERTALTFRPPPRTTVKGRVVLTDERVLSEADVVALPEVPQASNVAPPRPGRTRTGPDGRFSFDLDPGPYVLTVIPKAGTGFPRYVIRPEIPAQATELPDVRVPAPTRLSFTLRDPSPTGNPIANAIVRIFAAPRVPTGGASVGAPIEIGSAMTDPDGLVEILLAQEPR